MLKLIEFRFPTLAGPYQNRLSHWIVDVITAAYTSQGLECHFTSLNKGYHLLLSMVEKYVYSAYMLCSRLVFSEYLRQVLHAGHSVLGLLSAVGE